MVKATKAKVTRFDILWSFVAPTQPANPTDPADPAYNWSRIDQIMKGLKAAGVTPLRDRLQHAHLGGRGHQHAPSRQPTTRTPRGRRSTPTSCRRSRPGTAGRSRCPPAPTTRPAAAAADRDLERAEPEELLPVQHARPRSPSTRPSSRRPTRASRRPTRTPSSSAGSAGRAAARATATSAPRVLAELAGAEERAEVRRLLPAHLPVGRSQVRPAAASHAFPSWGSLPEIFATLDKKKKGMKLFVTEAGYTTGTTPVPPGEGDPGGAEPVPEADLHAAAGQEPAPGGGGLVQPPGQRQLARGAPVRERRAEAGVRDVLEDRRPADPAAAAPDAEALPGGGRSACEGVPPGAPSGRPDALAEAEHVVGVVRSSSRRPAAGGWRRSRRAATSSGRGRCSSGTRSPRRRAAWRGTRPGSSSARPRRPTAGSSRRRTGASRARCGGRRPSRPAPPG